MSTKATVFIIDIDLSTIIESEEDRINLWNDYLRLKKIYLIFNIKKI